jgi:hippurate hydrolase
MAAGPRNKGVKNMRKLMVGAAVVSAALIASTPAAADPLRDAIAADLPSLMTLYRDLHANPELSFQEFKTSAKLAAEARRLGFAVTEKVGQTGVVAVLKNGAGPTVMIRADMDGLPVVEQTGLPFASKQKGVSRSGTESGIMHACGHDTHMSAWVGTARQMVANKAKWSGTLVMILQPAEEVGQGARAMLADGLYTRFPKPDYALAFHDSAGQVAGEVGLTRGFALANVDSVDIKVHGVGGHGAYPQTTKDPIVLAARIVGSLQTLVSREIDPQDAAVVTVGSIHGGAKHNIISDEVMMLLTVRSYSDETRKLLLDGIKRIAKGEGEAAGMPADKMPEVRVADEFTPSTFNTPDLTSKMLALFTTGFGKSRVVETKPVMGGEDFSEFYRADKAGVQSVIFWVGGVPKADFDAAANGGKALPSLHSPFWKPDAEKVIATGAEALTMAAMHLMPK